MGSFRCLRLESEVLWPVPSVANSPVMGEVLCLLDREQRVLGVGGGFCTESDMPQPQ